MRSSLKKIFAGVLVVAMLATTYSFNSLAVTLDTLVTKESTINQERNKNNQTKYFEQFLNEKNQLLMKGDEGDGSVLTTMPTDNQDDKNTDTTTQNKDVVITTMPSDDKISPDDFANEKTGDEVEAEEDDNKENDNEANKTEDKAEQNKNDDLIKDLIDDKIGESIKIQISIDDEDIKDNKDFAVDKTALTNNIVIKEDTNEAVDDDTDTATDSETEDTSKAVFGINSNVKVGDHVYFGRYYKYNGDSNKYALEWVVVDVDTQNNRAKLVTKQVIDAKPILSASGQNFKFFNQTYLYDWLNGSEFLNSDAFTDEERNEILTVTSSIYERKTFGTLLGTPVAGQPEQEYIKTQLTERVTLPNWYEFIDSGNNASDLTDYARARIDKTIPIESAWINNLYNSSQQTPHTRLECKPDIDDYVYKKTIYHLYAGDPAFPAQKRVSKVEGTQQLGIKPMIWVSADYTFNTSDDTPIVNWETRGGQWANTSKRFDTFNAVVGVQASNMPGAGDVKKDNYTFTGWKMYRSYNDCHNDKNGTLLNNGILAGTWGEIWLGAVWERCNVDIDDTVIFGQYYKYSGIDKKYPLEWIVIDIDTQGKKVRLLTKEIIDAGPRCDDSIYFGSYQRSQPEMWLQSLRDSDAFTDEERANMVSVTNETFSQFKDDLAFLSHSDYDAYNNTTSLKYLNPNYTDYSLARAYLKEDYAHQGLYPRVYFLNTPAKKTQITYQGMPAYNDLECIYFSYNPTTFSSRDVKSEVKYIGYRPTVWVNMDYNFGTVEDTTSKQTKRIKIPTELIYRKDGYNTAAKAHVIRPQEAADFYQVLGLNKDEIGSINLGWAADHRPKEAYEIIDYYSDLRVKGNWSGQEKSIDPVEANTVNAALLYNDSSKKYDVYLFGMYALWRLDGQYYGIYWDLEEIAEEIKQDTGIDIKKHESKVNWVVGDGATWLKQKAKFDTYEEGTAHALPTSDDIARVGYTLDGWYINSDRNTTYTSIPNTQTGEITLTAKWIEREYVDLPISMMKTKSGNGNIHITPDKTKWKSQLGLDGEKIESLTHGDLDTTGKTLVNTIKYKSTEFRELDSQQIIASAIRSEFSLDENAKVQFMQYSGNDSIRDFTTNQVYDASYDHIEKANIVAKVYKDSEGKVYVDLTEGSTSGAFQFYLPSLSAFYDRFPKLLWDLSDLDMNSQDSSTEEDEYQEGYDITWVLGDGKFKDEYKSYENALHTITEDFILPGAETLDAPYRKILKEWTIGGVATTSISKDIHAPVTVVAVWTRSVGNFESYSIGKYKSSSIDTEEETALEWIILDKVDGKLLLTTKDIIDNKSYDTNGNAKFENSSISSWLNGEFYNQVFNDDQKVNILKEGKDKVFLLTEREAKDYFANDIQRTSKATDHAMHVDNGGENLDVKNGLAAYWLMTDADGNKAPYVTQNGIVNTEGIDVASKNIGVRPCIWVSETKISNIRSNPLNKLIDTINNQIEHFANFMNLFFGRKK